MDSRVESNDRCQRKPWVKPELEVLTVSSTSYCEYVWNEETGFYQVLCHSS